MNSSDKDTVELFQRVNRLRAKSGGNPNDDREGEIAPDMVMKADGLIEDFCKECPELMAHVLEKMTAKWKDMAGMGASSTREKLAQEIFTLAHEVKDVGGMCGYTLMADFGESLRDYITETKLDQDAQRVIVQAHVDAMNAALRLNLRDDGGPAADELKTLVKVAIDKYS